MTDIETLAEEEKKQGNTHFRLQEYDQAIFVYRRALEYLPPPQPTEQETESEANSLEEPESVIRARAILNSNIAACHGKMGDHQRSVEACSQALKDDPNYVKALNRRAASNEVISTWSSLTAAQEDYNKLLQILPSPSPERDATERSLKLLKPRLEVAQKKETEEMLGKLKGMGNSFLGHFGMSTDNFKFDPNGQGGYSVNFSR